MRLNETLSSEMSRRPEVKAKPAHPPTIAPMMESFGLIVLPDPAPFSKDETTTGSLHAINGIDVVAALVQEEDVWRFEVTKTRARKIQFQDGEQEPVAWLDPKGMWKRKAKEVQEFDEFNVKMEVRTLVKMGGNTKGSRQALVRVVWSQTSRRQYSVEIKDQVCQEMWMVEWLLWASSATEFLAMCSFGECQLHGSEGLAEQRYHPRISARNERSVCNACGGKS